MVIRIKHVSICWLGSYQASVGLKGNFVQKGTPPFPTGIKNTLLPVECLYLKSFKRIYLLDMLQEIVTRCAIYYSSCC